MERAGGAFKKPLFLLRAWLIYSRLEKNARKLFLVSGTKNAYIFRDRYSVMFLTRGLAKKCDRYRLLPIGK